MVETIDGGWGSLNDDGTWTGMIGMILRDEIDIAISDKTQQQTKTSYCHRELWPYYPFQIHYRCAINIWLGFQGVMFPPCH